MTVWTASAPEGRRALADQIGRRIADDGAEVTDLHLWQFESGHSCAIVLIVATSPKPPAVYKALPSGLPTLSHVTIEVNAASV